MLLWTTDFDTRELLNYIYSNQNFKLEFTAQVFKHSEIWNSAKWYFKISPSKQITFNYQWKSATHTKEIISVYCGSHMKPINYISSHNTALLTTIIASGLEGPQIKMTKSPFFFPYTSVINYMANVNRKITTSGKLFYNTHHRYYIWQMCGRWTQDTCSYNLLRKPDMMAKSGTMNKKIATA